MTKTAIITGASRGLGRALAAALAAGAWTVVLDARDGAALAAAAPPGDVRLLPGDITDPGHREALAAAAGEGLDLLVLNASTLGQAPLPPLAGYDLGELRSALETNVVAQLGLVQLALPALRRARGRVLALTSDAAVEAYAGWGGYGASKAALEGLARTLAVEETGVRVYAVDPGDMRTRMYQDAFPGEDISDRPEPEAVVPAILRLVEEDLPPGRYTATALAGMPA
jgi:NAD(P)-dependent dehydrogenase (short-subunit alcohol dehydrogenase family)